MSRPCALRRCFTGLFTVLVLAACSPTYDWREVRSDGLLALLPAKPASQTRELELAGLKVQMTMQSARADAMAFAVARVDLPAGSDAATRESIVDALRGALLRNAGGGTPVENAAGIGRSERGAPALPARALAVRGEQDGRKIALEARLIARDNHVWQVAVYGPAESMDKPDGRAAIDTFLLSLQID